MSERKRESKRKATEGKILNPRTGRWVNADGKVGRSLMAHKAPANSPWAQEWHRKWQGEPGYGRHLPKWSVSALREFNKRLAVLKDVGYTATSEDEAPLLMIADLLGRKGVPHFM